MKRIEFSARTKREAWERSCGVCQCGCGRPFTDHPKERPHYDHIVPAALGGDASLENCRVIRVECHQFKTTGEDIPRITKARRGEKKRLNIVGRKHRLPGGKGDKWKRKVGGGVALRHGDPS